MAVSVLTVKRGGVVITKLDVRNKCDGPTRGKTVAVVTIHGNEAFAALDTLACDVPGVVVTPAAGSVDDGGSVTLTFTPTRPGLRGRHVGALTATKDVAELSLPVVVLIDPPAVDPTRL